MRNAKIVCTIGPSSASRKIIAALIANGMDVARLNFSHGDHETHRKTASLVRSEARKQKKVVSLLQDLQGIKIRVGDIAGSGIELSAGQEILLCPGNDMSAADKLYISYPALIEDVKEGETVLLDDGLIKLTVTGKTETALKARVMEGGRLTSRKGVNLPASQTTLRAFTDKDRKDLAFGLTLGVDYVAVSFVRRAADIELVRNWAKRRKVRLPHLIAKIEKPEALSNIEAIMDVVEGIMVARGDLGVEMATEQVPIIQKSLIDLANRKGKLVITATQMLESMTHHTRPTRAEASDVANAVLDGSDALMLSAETAAGKYPVEALRMMHTIIRTTEVNLADRVYPSYEVGNTFPEAISDGACNAARDIGAKAIVVFTHTGFTARLLSKLRPCVPVIAFTPEEKVLRQMPLLWGVAGRLIKRADARILDNHFMAEIERAMMRDGIIYKGDSIVFVSSSPFLGNPNIVRLHKIG
jgi:pyruvate kinase